MNVSLIRKSAGQWLRIAAEARDAEAPPVVGWKLPHLGCGVELNARGAELLRDSAARHGDVFSLYLGGQLITVCQQQPFMHAFYNPGDETLGPIEAGDLDGLKGPHAALMSNGTHDVAGLQQVLTSYRDALPAVMRRALACRMPLSSWGRLNLVPTLGRWMKTLSRELLGGRGYAPNEGLDAATRSMAAVTALCLTHIGQDVALMGRLRQELEWLGDAKLAKAPLLNACLDEALRLYGPLLHFRKTLRPLQLGSHTVPAGRVVAFSPLLLHRDRNVYTKPDVFDPDRYFRGPRLARGPQQCARERFVRTLALACLDYLLRDREVLVSTDDHHNAVRWSLTGAAPSQPRWLYHGPTLRETLDRSESGKQPKSAAHQKRARRSETDKPSPLAEPSKSAEPTMPARRNEPPEHSNRNWLTVPMKRSKPRYSEPMKRSEPRYSEPMKRSKSKYSEPANGNAQKWRWARTNMSEANVADMAIRLRRKRVLTGLLRRPTDRETLLN